MEKLRNVTLFLYEHSLIRYLAVGGSTFLLDFGILFFLHGALDLNLAASTSVAYWASITYNFVLNRYWTFDAREKESLKRHITTYLMLLVANYLFTVVLVSVAGTYINYIYAKSIAVMVQMTWTYPIYKRYIFTGTSA